MKLGQFIQKLQDEAVEEFGGGVNLDDIEITYIAIGISDSLELDWDRDESDNILLAVTSL